MSLFTKLDLHKNQINDISPLTYLSNLENLMLVDNHIQNLEPLKNLLQLKNMDFHVNNISDLYALAENPVIDRYDVLDVTGNSLNDQIINEQIPELQRRGVTVIYK